MTDELETINQDKEDKDQKRKADAISGGIFFISLAVLLITGWWWPGIMFALGLAGGASLIFRRKYWGAIVTMALFFSIPIVIWVIQEINIPWTIFGALVLIGLGVIILAKAFLFRD